MGALRVCIPTPMSLSMFFSTLFSVLGHYYSYCGNVCFPRLLNSPQFFPNPCIPLHSIPPVPFTPLPLILEPATLPMIKSTQCNIIHHSRNISYWREVVTWLPFNSATSSWGPKCPINRCLYCMAWGSKPQVANPKSIKESSV